MQLPEQWKRSREWRVIATLATAGALGASGLVVASQGEASAEPNPIDLKERLSIGELRQSPALSPLPGSMVFDLDDRTGTASADSSDSPFDALADSPADSPDSSPADSTGQSVADSPAESPVDSPDSPADSPVDSPDSPADSPVDSPDSPDNSADS